MNEYYRKVKDIEQKNKKRLLAINPNLDDESGIYFLTRIDENEIKYAYIGQAIHILIRLAQHLAGYQQHIDLSLKKHGLYSAANPYGNSDRQRGKTATTQYRTSLRYTRKCIIHDSF